ncbi:hypothetical protein E2562_005487 [Oryza meyeriana var. granulata]|uniref:Homeobox domain-containing protein n=1 Tax=Oryza meyeriana var. granulata TaxID=110450 RepID=A0A6G1DFB0_9ORYZ|nr:hypothetical protein E2562_005487 [Oryza meyeriana var. granulata]KAF0911116.1 hypothetical protein E2562_005487 [Oryza meyeriana var. granulata]
MAHDPTLGFADYFSASDATASSVATLMPAMDDAAPELFGLQAGMELLGVRRLAMMPGATSKVAALVDAGGGDDEGGGSTMHFLSEQQHHHHQQPSQAQLSLSLCHPDGMLHLSGASRQQLAPAAPWMPSAPPPPPPPHVHGAWHLHSSRFLLPAQQLLQEFCSLSVDSTKRANAKASKQQSQQEDGRGDGSSSSSASWTPSPQIQAMEALELQRLKDKLYIMLEEVDRGYRRYCEQMRAVAGGFEAVAGERAAAAYTALASRTISRHFRSLRDGIVAQLQAVRKALGEKDDVRVAGMTRGETPRLKVIDQCIRHHKSLGAAAAMDSHPWRPQRGLPERAVTILRAWLFEHFLHPYPSDVDKHILARQTGLSRSQVSNWFINARVRLWKPMVEEMYVEEMKDQDGGSGSGGAQGSQNPRPTCSNASEARGGQKLVADGGDGDGDGGEQKPTRAQLRHDAGSLASVVNVGSNVDVARAGSGSGARLHQESFGIMDHLDFDAYDDSQHQHHVGFDTGGVSLTLGLQQHGSGDGGVNIAFGSPGAAHGGAGFLYPGEQMVDAVHPGHVQNVGQFGVAMDGGDASHAQQRFRSLSAGFHLLRDLAG